MSRAYKVRNIYSDREDAMKVLLPDFVSEPELATRLMVEIRTLAALLRTLPNSSKSSCRASAVNPLAGGIL